MSELSETLQYARVMMEYGRYDAARRSLSPFADDPEAHALLIELDAIIAAQDADPEAIRMTLLYSIEDAIRRIQTLDIGAKLIAPRWQRRYIVEVHVDDPQHILLSVRSRAASPYEFRYVPAKATLRLYAENEQHTQVILKAFTNRTYYVMMVLGTVSAIFFALYFTLQNLSTACLLMFPATFFTFYMVPTMMEHAKAVRDDLLEKIQAALTDDAMPHLTLPVAPIAQTLARPASALMDDLKALNGQRVPTTPWPSTLSVQHVADGERIRFRAQANPILFYHWVFMPPTVGGELIPIDGEQTRLEIKPQRRNDLLILWLSAIFLLVAIGTSLAGASIIMRLIILAFTVGALGANYAVAQQSMDARGATLAQYIQQILQRHSF